MIDSVLHYIQANWNQDLPLHKLAEQANYSPYHFLRLFKSQVGEAPKQYILRIRLEKACKELIFYPEKTIYAIAFDCGFSSQAVFARAFKQRFGMSAEQYRKQHLSEIADKTSEQIKHYKDAPIEIKALESFTVVYEVTFLDDEESIMQAFKNIYQWAAARDLIQRDHQYCGIFLDSPHTTKLSQCRYLAGIRVAAKEYERPAKTLGGMKYLQAPVTGNVAEMMEYAMFIKKVWITDTGYEVTPERLGFELFPALDFTKPYAQQHRNICIGVRPK